MPPRRARVSADLEKMKSGSVFEIAEVLRDLCVLRPTAELQPPGHRVHARPTHGRPARTRRARRASADGQIRAPVIW